MIARRGKRCYNNSSKTVVVSEEGEKREGLSFSGGFWDLQREGRISGLIALKITGKASG